MTLNPWSDRVIGTAGRNVVALGDMMKHYNFINHGIAMHRTFRAYGESGKRRRHGNWRKMWPRSSE